MSNRRGVGRTEIIVGIAVVAVLALISIPLWLSSSNKGNRAEVPLNVEAIRLAEITYEQAFDDYISAAASPRGPTEVNADPVAWAPSPGFVDLAWEPDNKAAIFGSYAVVASDDGFTVTGVCDVDGDGQRATFTASKDAEATMTSGEDVY